MPRRERVLTLLGFIERVHNSNFWNTDFVKKKRCVGLLPVFLQTPTNRCKSYVKKEEEADMWKEKYIPVSSEPQGKIPWGLSKVTSKWSLLENRGTRNACDWRHITVSLTSEASPLCILYPGVYNGLNHYIHKMPFTWKLNFGLHVVRKNWTVFIAKKPQVQGVSSDCGRNVYIFFCQKECFLAILSAI